MKLTVTGIEQDRPIPERYAFGAPDNDSPMRLSDNRNPGVEWSSVPEGTRSLVLMCVDPDAPSDPADANQQGREVSADLKRTEFYHWVMVDLPPEGRIEEGAVADGITPHGKQHPAGPDGSRQGLNTYTMWFDGDEDMEGRYFGYDGPCPPWNDARLHHYHFWLLAIDLPRCPVEGAFEAGDVMAAIEGHVLGEAEVVGTYTLNPNLMKPG
ncbi:MAG TPA: YbhB/YbcL family Raf kinase inhibitor-like protein [Gammaproteobacteria bacterium]|nr:YbhB/YbcL family Raf kinase inhibitor-like protein [Gammaproteobacteria bacterium]